MVNFIVCGTPGTGKSSIIEKLKVKLGQNGFVNFIDISQFAIDNDCIEEYDANLDTKVIDEDKLSEKIEPILRDQTKFNIIESIHGDIFSSDLIDHAFVVILDNHSILYDRLVARNYNQLKLNNNVECEIFQQIKDDCLEEFGPDKVTVLYNDSQSYLMPNVDSITDKFSIFCEKNSLSYEIN